MIITRALGSFQDHGVICSQRNKLYLQKVKTGSEFQWSPSSFAPSSEPSKETLSLQKLSVSKKPGSEWLRDGIQPQM